MEAKVITRELSKIKLQIKLLNIRLEDREADLLSARQEGRKEVVEFLKEHRHQELLVGAHRFVFTENEWQSQLKEWGIA